MSTKNLSRLFLIAALSSIALTISSHAVAKSVWDGIKKDDPNPGSVPDIILEEPTSIEIKDLGGHKVYAGQDTLKSSSYAYLNVDFDCDGKAKFEAYPRSNNGGPAEITEGIYNWTLRDDHARVTLELEEYTKNKFFMNDSLDVEVIPRTGSLLVVGQAALRHVVVSRIVKYKDCNKTAEKVEGISTTFYKNPGDIPATIIDEPDSLALTNLGGHKVFAGPDENLLAYYLYFNVDFNCDGTGTFEAYPPEFPKGSPKAFLFKITKGTFKWEVRKKNRQVQIDIVDFTEGSFIAQKDIDFGELGRGDKSRVVVASSSDLENRYVSRIVKHTECGG